ncbi:MAG: trigger factor [Epsilonproteobacteria bacterium]|nr:trigger factor [Campylobacterota bacterium]NPA57160.1 trigger factor [Campylobacterota bacterium]
MEIQATRVDNANAKIEAKISKEEIQKREEKAIKSLAKELKIPGFRKGKVPPALVRQRYGEKVAQDVERELIQEAINQGFNDLQIKREDMLGDPLFTKFEKGEEGIELELEIGFRPQIDTSGYEELIPEVKEPEVSDEEVEERLKKLVEATAQFIENPRRKVAKEGDLVVIDFKGTLEDGTPIEGGSAENFELLLGSGQFIPGFEDQIVGMRKDETRTIKVTFPEDYPNKELAGKPAQFEVTLKAIKEKEKIEVNDEFAKRVMPGVEDANLEKLREEIRKQLKNEKLTKLYNDELKPKLIEALVEEFQFDLPQNIVDQEINVQLNGRMASMTKEEVEELQKNREKLEALKEEIRPEAEKSVKATFIVDALAKVEGIEVDDREVVQTIYYEALQMGRNPQEILEAYEKQGLLPAVKMAMIEDKLLTHLLNKKLEREAA